MLFRSGKYAEAIKQCEAALALAGKHNPQHSSFETYRNLIQKSQSILRNDVLVFKIKELTPNEEAEKLGAKVGDIFLMFGDWKWDERVPLYHTMPQKFSSELRKLDNHSKKIVFARKKGDKYEIVNIVFPKGKIGVTYSWKYFPAKWAQDFSRKLKSE